MVKDLFQCCLYFTANALARSMTALAEDEFKRTGLSPNYGFLLMLAIETPGISQKEVAEMLNLTPSTITRFVDKLESKGLVERSVEGKSVLLQPTLKGKAMLPEIEASWERLYHRYSEAIGYEEGKNITGLICQTARRLESTQR